MKNELNIISPILLMVKILHKLGGSNAGTEVHVGIWLELGSYWIMATQQANTYSYWNNILS